MELGEAKDRVRKILDEHSSGGKVEQDQDIELRLNALFDSQQKRLATVRKIIKTYEVPLQAGASPQVYAMPEDFYRPFRLWADNMQIGRGTWRGKSLILPGDEQRDIVVEYYAFPSAITDSTPDSYQLELDEDAAVCACYFVAVDVALVDLVIDSGKILQLANQMLEGLHKDAEPQQAVIRTDLAAEGGRGQWQY